MTRLNEKTVTKIYSMTAAGKTPAEIADLVNAEYGTVYYHVKKARETETSKLDVAPKDYVETPAAPEAQADESTSEQTSEHNVVLTLGVAAAIGFAAGVYFGMQIGAL